MGGAGRTRCPWPTNPLAVAYHDDEWGVPCRDERRLFEQLNLEGAQAGLSWDTILAKRARYREVFAGFDPERVARFGARDITRLLGDAGIVRHRGKLEATRDNARAWLALREVEGDVVAWLWSFVGGAPVVNRWRRMADVPASTPGSEELGRALKARGFRFVGPTTCYAFQQAAGMVDDHLVSCFRHADARG